MITHYSFGQLVFKDHTYTKDLIIIRTQHIESILDSWWRKEGHKLQIEDLEEVWGSGVKFLIVGTGARGLMQVDEKVKNKAEELGIKLEVYLTEEAVKRFNELYLKGEPLAGAFHLTC